MNMSCKNIHWDTNNGITCEKQWTNLVRVCVTRDMGNAKWENIGSVREDGEQEEEEEEGIVFSCECENA